MSNFLNTNKKVENATETFDLQYLKYSIYGPYRKDVVMFLNDELQIKLSQLALFSEGRTKYHTLELRDGGFYLMVTMAARRV